MGPDRLSPVIYDYHGGANQKWEFAANGTLRSMSKCLDVTDANPNNGTPLQLWDCNPGQDNETWRKG